MLRLASLAAASALVALAGGYYAWVRPLFAPTNSSRAVPQTLAAAVTAVCDEVPSELPKPRRALRPTLVAPLVGDRDDLVAGGLRSALMQQGWYQPVEPDLLERAWAQLGPAPTAVTDAKTARDLAARADAEVVIWGEVERLEFDPEAESPMAWVEFSLTAAEVESGATLYAGRFPLPDRTSGSESTEAGSSNARPQAAAGLPWRLILLLTSAGLLWPVAMSWPMRRVLRYERNALTLAVLALSIGAPLAIAWYLLQPASTAGSLAMFATGAVLMASWTAAALDWFAGKQAW